MADEADFSLDMTLDDIDDLPEFKAFPTGAYLVLLAKGIEDKTAAGNMINDKPALTVPMTLVEIVELEEKNLDEGEVAPKVDDVATVAFMMNKDEKSGQAIGQGMFKRFAAPIMETAGATNIRELIQKSKGMKLLVVLQRTTDKNDKSKHYNRFVKIDVV